jgi:hypothetical protein
MVYRNLAAMDASEIENIRRRAADLRAHLDLL